MTLLRDNALQALRNLGAGDHSTRDVWWQVNHRRADEGSAYVTRSGDVENALHDLWEAGLVEQRPHGRWRVAAGTGRQTQINEDREG